MHAVKLNFGGCSAEFVQRNMAARWNARLGEKLQAAGIPVELAHDSIVVESAQHAEKIVQIVSELNQEMKTWGHDE